MVYKFIFHLQLCWADTLGSAAVIQAVATASSAGRPICTRAGCHRRSGADLSRHVVCKMASQERFKILFLTLFAKYTILRKQISEQRLFSHPHPKKTQKTLNRGKTIQALSPCFSVSPWHLLTGNLEQTLWIRNDFICKMGCGGS